MNDKQMDTIVELSYKGYYFSIHVESENSPIYFTINEQIYKPFNNEKSIFVPYIYVKNNLIQFGSKWNMETQLPNNEYHNYKVICFDENKTINLTPKIGDVNVVFRFKYNSFDIIDLYS